MHDSVHYNADPEDDSSTTSNNNNNNSNKQMENDHNTIGNAENYEVETNFLSKDANGTEQMISSQITMSPSNEGDGPIKIKKMENCHNESSTMVNNGCNLVHPNKFPEACLNEIEHLFKKPRWTIQVPYQQFEQLLDFAINLIQSGQDEHDEACQRFTSETIIHFFTKFCVDETSEAFMEDSKQMISLSFKLIQVVVLCLKKNYRLMELLSHLFSTSNRFSFLSCNENMNHISTQQSYANENEQRFQNSLLVALINYFGQLGGFDILLSCFKEQNLTSFLIFAYLKPFNNCIDFLSPRTLRTYFAPIMKLVPSYFNNLSDEDLKKELKSEAKTDFISLIVRMCKSFALKMFQNETAKAFEFLRLKLTLRVLQLSSFSGKMNALNEINKTILFYNNEDQNYSLVNSCSESLATSKEIAQWLIENNVLEIILKDCLHQPQYVEKLDNIIRFLLKEDALTLDCLDKIWNSQLDKHEIIVKNIHDLIAKLAWNFSPNQLNHLFLCFESSWSTAAKKEREKLLELMRRLAEDDKYGSMAYKVLTLLWNIAYNDSEVDSDIVDQALSAHLKILDYSKTCEKDNQKCHWLKQCIEEFKKSDYGNNVITAMKQIREICLLFPGYQANKPVSSSKNKQFYKPRCKQDSRQDILVRIQDEYDFASMLIQNLAIYMQWMRSVHQQASGQINPNLVRSGRRFSHCQEIQERLDFFRFFLQEGELWLCASQANEIWNCLAQNAIFPSDRQICFQWFSSLMDCESDLDPEIYFNFLKSNISKLDPSLVDVYGVECFEKFFKAVNTNQKKLINRNQIYLMEDCDLIGLDYLWKLILFCENEAASKAINLLKDFYTNLGPKLIQSQIELHHDLINTCFDRLKSSYDTVSIIEYDKDESRVQLELTKMTRVLSVLCEYINKCDGDYSHDKTNLPMSQCFRGNQVILTIKFINYSRNNEELELRTHTNETLFSIKNKILTTLKIAENFDIEFYNQGEKVDLSIMKLVSELTTKREMNLSARIMNANKISCSSEMEFSNSLKRNSLQKRNSLPGVIMSKDSKYTNFLFCVADLAMSLNHDSLREKCLLILKLIPPDVNYVNFIRNFFINQNHTTNDNIETLNQQFGQEFLSSPTKTVYLLGIIFTLLLPANNNSLYGDLQNFQTSFISSGYCLRIINFLNEPTFLNKADNYCKICALLRILKISKFALSTLCYLKMYASQSNENMKETLKYVPNDFALRNVAINVSQNIFKNLQTKNKINVLPAELDFVPNSQLIDSVLMVAWSTATGIWKFNVNTDKSVLHNYFVSNYQQNDITSISKSNEIYEVCNEALELLTIMFMLAPQEAHLYVDNNKWNEFLIDLLLLCPDESIRTNMMEQFTLILTKCMKNQDILESILNLMFSLLQTNVPKFHQTSSQFFKLCCNLLKFAFLNKIRLPIINDLLQYEYGLLNNPKHNFYFNDHYEETLLEGHLKITKELISFLSSDIKFTVGCRNQMGLVNLLLDQYLFTASKSLCLFRQNPEVLVDDIYPVCSGSKSLIAAYELLVALCNGCVGNLTFVCQNLESYMNTFSVFSWEYFPNIGTRPVQGFVGLKNAGATCYMNSVLQQLFMIPEVRNGILSVIIDSPYHFEDSNEENYFFNENKSLVAEDAKTYNIGILKQIQIIFGHLLLSQSQYYVPKGFWQHFKLFGGQINLREQQDALEFFNSLFDSLDEAFKVLNQPSIMSNIFGGSFSDQKICKDCPHRYYREESFTTLNVDVRNHHSLSDSLEQYVRGDLLEGDNAYYCEKCDRKVNTIKRLCIKKLPKVLVIQLKRFDYDYEREVSIKFNDYFEFPRVLNMEPYTVNGLARKEGEIIEEDLINDRENNITEYELNGIVVHSGQANGGHYYSFIRHQTDDGRKKWYKFDDVDVSQCKLDHDEEMKNQCFGGDYSAEVYDQLLKKISQKVQKRWWNAFILVYRKVDGERSDSVNPLLMPVPIRKNIQHQNIVFMHQRTLFSEEFYHFMKSLLECNNRNNHLNTDLFVKMEFEKIITETLNIASKFLFSFCFRAKKSLRCSAMEWYDSILPYLKSNSSIRTWFIKKHLLDYSNIFYEFLLECPSSDVRFAFSKIILLLAHYTLLEKDSCADEIMSVLINLTRKEVPEYIRQSTQYFNLFYEYAKLGVQERHHLLKFDVPSSFILIVTDQGSGLTIKGQCIDCKFYQVVSILVRCCDTSNLITLPNNQPNPFIYEDNKDFIMQLPENIHETLFLNKLYLKKVIKDAITLDENGKLIKFCCWENQSFSKNVIDELLAIISNSYTTYELDPYFCILHEILLMDDSWQEFRIQLAFVGDVIDKLCNHEANIQKAIFEMIQCQTIHFEKKTYQCIQFLVNLFRSSERTVNIVKDNPIIKTKWFITINRLKEELNKKFSMFYMQSYSSSNWSSTVDSSKHSFDMAKNVHTLLKEIETIFVDEEQLQNDQMMNSQCSGINDNSSLIVEDKNDETLSSDLNSMDISSSERSLSTDQKNSFLS